MTDQTSIALPAPIGLTRQVGVTEPGSPLPVSRGSSVSSPRAIENPDEIMRRRLCHYKTYLEHEIDFVGNEITALINRVPGDNPHDEEILLELRDGLKVRFNTLQNRYTRVKQLLDVM